MPLRDPTIEASLFVCSKCGPRVAVYVNARWVRCGCGKRCKRVTTTKDEGQSVMRGDTKYEEAKES